jgi:aryl-alcohol dehydrogenase-like predicted oxidoreductase
MKLALGCMNFGKRTSEKDSLAIIDRALGAGVRVLDTANVYNDGVSETIVGKAIQRRRDAVTIATKVGYGRVDGKPEGLSPAAVTRACDASLARLGIDAIDIYYLHVPDPAVPIEDTLGALAALAQAGKIRAVGVSNYASWQILEMFPICDRLGLARPAISQVIYNLLVRQIEVEYLKFARKYAVHSTVYNPLAGGLLAGALDRAHGIPKGSRFDNNKQYQRRYWTDHMFDAAASLAAAAAAHERTLLELAYGWLAARPGVDSILIGPGSLAHLDAALAAVARPLPAELAARADEIHAELLGTDASYAR